MKYSDIKQMVFSKDDVLSAVKHARKEHFEDNLRNRNEFVAFDSKARGYLGEIYLKKLFESNDIEILKIDYEIDGFETDIDFVIKNKDNESLKIECKTSLIPDVYKTLENSINKCDIKIIRREKHYTSISIDVHVQIYYDELRNERDSRLSSIIGAVSDYNDEEIIDVLELEKIDGYFVAWIDKNSLNEYLEKLPMYSRLWKFGFRSFWKCPLLISRAPSDLIDFLKR